MDDDSLVFLKDEKKFKIEAEYRVAIFFPFDERTILNAGEKKVALFNYKEKGDYFMWLDNGFEDKFKSFVLGYYTYPS